jgi:hypothetical protein
MAAFIGFYESHHVRYSTGAAMAIKTTSKVSTFCIIVVLIVALAAAGAI